MTVICAVMEKRSLQLSSMSWLNMRKKVWNILDLVDSDPEVHSIVNRFVKAVDVSCCTAIVVIALEYFSSAELLQGWT